MQERRYHGHPLRPSSQKQLKLKDDAKIVEDSLLSLANRVFQIASFVTREVGEMNNHMDKSVEAIKERKKPRAVSEQQFAMTSINNLALLLDDVLQQMQDAMHNQMGHMIRKLDALRCRLGSTRVECNGDIAQFCLWSGGRQHRHLAYGLCGAFF